MAITHPLYDEVIAWVNTLGPTALADARDEHNKRYGGAIAHGEAIPYLIATRGTDRIKDVWRQWTTMTGEEKFNGRNRD